jgi:endosialidase-like protein
MKMNEHTDIDQQAELAALRQRLDKLEAEHREFQRNASRRPVVPSKFLLSALAVVLVFAGGLLGQEVKSLFIDPKGNVGIGTQSPTYPLDVRGDFRVVNDDTKLQGFTGRWDGSYTTINSYKWSDPAGPQPLRVDGSVLSLNSTTGGNVGIGTTSPAEKLEIAGTKEQGGRAIVSDGGGENRRVILIEAPGKNNFGRIVAYQYGATAGGKDLILQDTGGNVGIGNASPTQKLDVAGNVKVSGALGVGSNVDVTRSASGYLLVGDYLNVRGNTLLNGVVAIGREPIANQQLTIQPKSGFIPFNVTDPNNTKNLLTVDANGNVLIDNDLKIKGDVIHLSDLRLKTAIHPLPGALEKVLKLHGVTYLWNQLGLDYFVDKQSSSSPDSMNEAERKLWEEQRDKRCQEFSKPNVGLIAQEVEAVLPEAVSTDEKGYKYMRYDSLIPLLIEAVKEQDQVMKEQARIVAQQQAEVQRLAFIQQTTQRQLAELASVKTQVAHLEAAISKLAGSDSSGDHNALISSAEGSN